MFSNFTDDFFSEGQKKRTKKLLLPVFKKHSKKRVKKLKTKEK